MIDIELQEARCAICDTAGNACELYPAKFDFKTLNSSLFSARRLPDQIHYRLVKCNTCGLVRSDPILYPEVLAQLYRQSPSDYTN